MTEWHSGPAEGYEGDLTTYHTKAVPEEPDRRYRILILLQRSDRPKYWSFHCMHCQAFVVELVNCEVQGASDLLDTTTNGNTAIGTRCSGKFCRYWYYFKLNGATLNGK